MALHIVRIALLILLLHTIPRQVAAEQSFTKLVFDSCDEALLQYQKSSPNDQIKLAEQLRSILSLNIAPPSSAEAFASIHPLTDVTTDQQLRPVKTERWVGIQWQNTDPSREFAAKKCALHILSESGEASLSALSDIIEIYSQGTLSNELAVEFEEATAHILDAASKSKRSPEPSALQAVIPFALSDNSRLARDFLKEFRSQSIPLIIKEGVAQTKGNTDTLRALLEDFGPGTPEPFEAFLDQIPFLAVDEVSALSLAVPLPNPKTTTQYADTLLALISEHSLTAQLLHLVGRICVQRGGLALTARSEAALSDTDGIFAPNRLQPTQVRCLLRSSPVLTSKAIESLTRSQAAKSERYILNLLSHQDSFPNRNLSERAYYTLQRRILRKETQNTISILSTLGSFVRFSTENANTALSLLESILDGKLYSHDPAPYRQAALKLLKTSGKGDSHPKYANIIGKLLRIQDLSDTELTLIGSLSSLPNRLWWMATSSIRTPLARNALKVISLREYPHRGLAARFIPLLENTDESTYASKVLLSYGSSSIPLLKMAVANSPQRIGWQLALTIAALEPNPREEISALAKTTLEAFSCNHSIDWAPVVRAATFSSVTSIRGAALEKISKCLLEYPAQIVVSYADDNIAVVEKISKQLIAATSTHNSPTAEWRTTLLQGLSISPETISTYDSLLASLLTIDPDHTVAMFPALLELQTTSTPLTVEALTQIVNSDNLQHLIMRWHLVHLLAVNAKAQVPLSKILNMAIAELSSYRVSAELFGALRMLPNEATLRLVNDKLSTTDRATLVGASLAGAAYGSHALPILSRLWSLRHHQDPIVRDAAVLALLIINPLSPDLEKLLENILGNRSFDLAQKLPIHWSKTLAFNELSVKSFGSLRTSRIQYLLEHEMDKLELSKKY